MTSRSGSPTTNCVFSMAVWLDIKGQPEWVHGPSSWLSFMCTASVSLCLYSVQGLRYLHCWSGPTFVFFQGKSMGNHSVPCEAHGTNISGHPNISRSLQLQSMLHTFPKVLLPRRLQVDSSATSSMCSLPAIHVPNLIIPLQPAMALGGASLSVVRWVSWGTLGAFLQ